jgi:hypothetical protein
MLGVNGAHHDWDAACAGRGVSSGPSDASDIRSPASKATIGHEATPPVAREDQPARDPASGSVDGSKLQSWRSAHSSNLSMLIGISRSTDVMSTLNG